MPIVTILVTQEDIAAAKRIAAKMFPDQLDLLEARHAIATAAHIGIESLKVRWHDAEKDKPPETVAVRGEDRPLSEFDKGKTDANESA